MLALSALIALALATAVASFFISGGLWLLAPCGLLIALAFGVSRQAARRHGQPPDPPRPPRPPLRVSVDQRIVAKGSGRHRRSVDATDANADT
jgi:hypothetical protein